MVGEITTNKELARVFFGIISQFHIYETRHIKYLKTKITELSVNLPEIYQNNGSLEGMTIISKGAAKDEINEILEIILENGVENAQKKLYERLYIKIQKAQFNVIQSTTTPRVDDDDDPSYHDATRMREGL